MPPRTIYCGRPTIWGNPFVGIGAVDAYRYWLAREGMVYLPTWCEDCNCRGVITVSGMAIQMQQVIYDSHSEMENARIEIIGRLSHLGGFDLACWCPLGEPCHVDVLLELANP
jgi:hypothetical protein